MMLWTFLGVKECVFVPNALFFSKNRQFWSLDNSPAPGGYETNPYLCWQPVIMVANLLMAMWQSWSAPLTWFMRNPMADLGSYQAAKFTDDLNLVIQMYTIQGLSMCTPIWYWVRSFPAYNWWFLTNNCHLLSGFAINSWVFVRSWKNYLPRGDCNLSSDLYNKFSNSLYVRI
jgi:hypothetical protein